MRNQDDEDQRRLREVVAADVQAVMNKHGVGGIVLLVSRDSAAWHTVFPTWSFLQPDPVHGMALRIKAKANDVEAQSRATDTMHLIGAIRDMSSDLANLYGRFWRQAVDAFKAAGAEVTHESFGAGRGVGGQPDPMGGKVQ